MKVLRLRGLYSRLPLTTAALLSVACFHVAAEGDRPLAGSTFQDCENCPEMTVIPAGQFEMGVEGGEFGRYEGPVHTVNITRPFAIGTYEVTNAQYRSFVEATGHPSTGGCRIFDGVKPTAMEGNSWEDPGYGRPAKPDEPVACVHWLDAKAYVEWLADETGKPYRLPSEAEWEYVARGKSPKTRFFWGDDPNGACEYANVFDVSSAEIDNPRPIPSVTCEDGFADVAPVGQLKANAYGVYDIIGNVWEWVEDCYVMTFFEWQNDETAQTRYGCDRRGVRGGSWSTSPDRQRPEFRGRDPVKLVSQIFGLRVAMDL